MRTLTFLIHLILCAVLQHEIIASSSDDEDSTTIFLIHPKKKIGEPGYQTPRLSFKNPPSSTYLPNFHVVDTENPTKVKLMYLNDYVGDGLALHPYWVVARPASYRSGVVVFSYKDKKRPSYKPYKFFQENNILFIQMKERIRLDFPVTGGFHKEGYSAEETKYAAEYVQKQTTPQKSQNSNPGPSKI